MLEVSVPASDKRKARVARLSIRFSQTCAESRAELVEALSKHSIEAADAQTCAELVEVKAEKLPLIKVWAVLVREENSPQDEEPMLRQAQHK